MKFFLGSFFFSTFSVEKWRNLKKSLIQLALNQFFHGAEGIYPKPEFLVLVMPLICIYQTRLRMDHCTMTVSHWEKNENWQPVIDDLRYQIKCLKIRRDGVHLVKVSLCEKKQVNIIITRLSSCLMWHSNDSLLHGWVRPSK